MIYGCFHTSTLNERKPRREKGGKKAKKTTNLFIQRRKRSTIVITFRFAMPGDHIHIDNLVIIARTRKVAISDRLHRLTIPVSADEYCASGGAFLAHDLDNNVAYDSRT